MPWKKHQPVLPDDLTRIGSVFFLILLAIMGGALLSDHPSASSLDTQLALYLPLDGETDEHAIGIDRGGR